MKLFRILFATLLSLPMTSHAETVGPVQTNTTKIRQELNTSLDKIEARLNELEIKSKGLSASARAEWQSTVTDLKKHRDELKADINKGKEQTAEKAKDYWSRIKAAVKDLEKGVSAAGDKIKGSKNE